LTSAPPDNVREQCRIIMDMLHFDPPGQVTLTNPLRLLTLPVPIQQMLLDETLTVDQAQEVLVLNDPGDQASLPRQASHGKMSVLDLISTPLFSPNRNRIPNSKKAISDGWSQADVVDDV
jgi:hypothetical protein